MRVSNERLAEMVANSPWPAVSEVGGLVLDLADARVKIAALEQQREELREAMCKLMGIDGSAESLDRMRAGIVLAADEAPDPEAAEAAMAAIEALAATAEQQEDGGRRAREACIGAQLPAGFIEKMGLHDSQEEQHD
jgi:hypothetical protein